MSYLAEPAEEIEARLAEARAALGSADAGDAEAALNAAERLLRDHPELPQAACLRAEQLSVRANIAAGTQAAAALRAGALVLEGPRSRPFHACRARAPRRGSDLGGLGRGE